MQGIVLMKERMIPVGHEKSKPVRRRRRRRWWWWWWWWWYDIWGIIAGTVLWDIRPYSLVDRYGCFGGTWCVPSSDTFCKTFRSVQRVSLKIRCSCPACMKLEMARQGLDELSIIRFCGSFMWWFCIETDLQADKRTGLFFLTGAAQNCHDVSGNTALR